MIKENWCYKRVRDDGVVEGGGAVETTRIIRASVTGKCWLADCKCSTGIWLSMNFGLDTATSSVSGVTFRFDNLIEFRRFLQERNLIFISRSGIVHSSLDRLEPSRFDIDSLN